MRSVPGAVASEPMQPPHEYQVFLERNEATKIMHEKVLAAFALSVPLLCAHAAPGDLDTSFGTDGHATVGTGQYSGVSEIAILADGSILGTTAGNNNALVVFRLTPNGSPDASFGTDGIAPIATGAFAVDLVVDDAGRIYLAYSTGDTVYSVARLLPSGAPDTSFGLDGRVQISVGTLLGTGTTANRTRGMTLLPDGKLLLIGNFWAGQIANQDVGLVRLNSDGTPDASFGTGGASPVRLLNLRPVWGIEATLQSDGKIVLVAAENTNLSTNVWVLRYLADGSDIDESFGELGLAQIDLEAPVGDNTGRTVGTDVLVQPDDKVLVAGRVGSAGLDTFVARFSADGVLDTSFSGDGYIILPSAVNRGATELAMQPDGKILVSDSGGVTRLTSSGEIDTSFAMGGTATSGSPIASREADSIAVQPDGAIVAGGSTFDPGTSDTDPLIVRYEGDNLDLTPDVFAFADASSVPPGAVVTSDTVSVTGLSVGVFVPVTVSGGELAVGGSGPFGSGTGYATTGTELVVRHTAGATQGVSVETTLRVGGLLPHNNLMTPLGTTVSDTFTSTTGTGDGDRDGDGIPDDTDNAPDDANPDQSDIDVDGVGDVADPCPADPGDGCNVQGSAAESIDAAGGTVATPDGSVSVDVPGGALASHTSISITDLGTGFTVTTDVGDTTSIIAVTIGPDGTTFGIPIDVLFSWPDADDDGIVDDTTDSEADLRVFKDGVAITGACATEVGCNRTANTFAVQVSSLSDFVLGAVPTNDQPPALISGKKLLVKRLKSGAQKMVFLAKDSAVVASNPCEVGGALVIESIGAGTGAMVFPLDGSLWKPIKKKKPEQGCRYRKGAVAKTALIKTGKLLKVVATSTDLGIPLDTDPSPVRVELRHGTQRHCLEFGSGGKYRVDRKLVVRNAEPALGCPSPGSPSLSLGPSGLR